MADETVCIDKTGTPIVAGDYIVYGHALGRCAGLRFGKVLNVHARKEKDCYTSETFALTVIGVDDDWLRHEAQALARPSALQFPRTRVIVLPADRIPPPIRGLLDSFVWSPKKSEKPPNP